jgi:hypothetical protein
MVIAKPPGWAAEAIVVHFGGAPLSIGCDCFAGDGSQRQFESR